MTVQLVMLEVCGDGRVDAGRWDLSHKVWTDPRVRALSGKARALWMYVLTSPFTLLEDDALVHPLVESDTLFGFGRRQYADAVDELLATGLARLDDECLAVPVEPIAEFLSRNGTVAEDIMGSRDVVDPTDDDLEVG